MLTLSHLTHTYPDGRNALSDLSLLIHPGEIFAFLGPNGSGKSTTFRILSTLMPPTSGTVIYDFAGRPPLTLAPDTLQEIRRHLGVVFQSPSLDKELTAYENLLHHGHLYGLSGRTLSARISSLLESVNLVDRAKERVKNFSGGMRRRVEIAKALLNSPPLLLLDEPSTGLDPGARVDMWTLLHSIQKQGVTILLTTHLMEEADLATRLAIMHQGRCVSLGTPDELKSQISGDVVTLRTKDAPRIAGILKDQFSIASDISGDTVRFEYANGAEFIPRMVAAMPNELDAISVNKPTLQDVFLRTTGHSLFP